MELVVLFCKSYAGDVYRARRMVESVNRFNCDEIPLFVSVPEADMALFKDLFNGVKCNLITDESILDRTISVYGAIPKSFPSHLIQQLIKLEFWRMGLCSHYVWLDSDSFFIKPFGKTIFFDNNAVPFTIQHHSNELREFSQRYDKVIIEDFERMASRVQGLFGRSGPIYDFGYPPLIWSCKVLQNFHEEYLRPRNTTIFEILEHYPSEMHLYGEYLHHSGAIPIVAREPLFKVFHYREQFLESQELGESEFSLSKDYVGIIIQSNWARVEKEIFCIRIKKMIRRMRRQVKSLFNR